MIETGTIVSVRGDYQNQNSPIAYAQVKINLTDQQAYQVIIGLARGENWYSLLNKTIQFIPQPGTAQGFLVSR